MPDIAYQRALLKLSGDILKGNEPNGIDFKVVARIAAEIRESHLDGLQLGIVVGGGNLVRGAEVEKAGVDRITADNMGMLSTLVNALALQNALERLSVETRVMSAIEVHELVEPFIRRRALRHIEKGRVVIFAGGTGNPLFTTDTAAALRASQIGAEIIFKGTKVDGIFDRDPVLFRDAVKFDEVSYMEIIKKGLRVMDLTAITFCRDFQIPIVVFNILKHGNFRHIVCGEPIGTKVIEV
ncbi:MAG: UMP kinase [Calditrichaeota bacterium]|nr:UMP kinase [Calditrichota bacterium]